MMPSPRSEDEGGMEGPKATGRDLEAPWWKGRFGVRMSFISPLREAMNSIFFRPIFVHTDHGPSTGSHLTPVDHVDDDLGL